MERFVRAMTPWPGAWTTLAATGGKARLRVRVAQAAVLNGAQAATGAAGEWTVRDGALLCACGGGTLRILALQPEGKKEMPVAAFLNGAGRAFAAGGRAE